MATALVLLSGGLDSMLAARILLEQGVEVTGLTFISNFFGAAKGLAAAKQLGVPLIAYNIAPKHLEMVKQPKYGYGKNMNPCIDCHALMLREAKEIMAGKEMVLVYPDGRLKAVAQNYDFVATGEVLGQRPMSQNKDALGVVAKYSGIGDNLLRPLCAKLLAETLPEKFGKVDRDKLLDISGRSRQRQVELAAKFGLKDYPSPAGGCLLTDPGFSKKLKELLAYWPQCQGGDVELIKHGRVFWLTSEVGDAAEKVLLVIGRNQEDNGALQKMAKSGDIIVQIVEENGPTALIRSNNKNLDVGDRKFELIVPEMLDHNSLKFGEAKTKDEIIGLSARLIGHYAVKARGKQVEIKVKTI
jgi:tRNA U34 2-thiouridine synthase MnmA/TrmU